jgi:hypothetical protein
VGLKGNTHYKLSLSKTSIQSKCPLHPLQAACTTTTVTAVPNINIGYNISGYCRAESMIQLLQHEQNHSTSYCTQYKPIKSHTHTHTHVKVNSLAALTWGYSWTQLGTRMRTDYTDVGLAKSHPLPVNSHSQKKPGEFVLVYIPWHMPGSKSQPGSEV